VRARVACGARDPKENPKGESDMGDEKQAAIDFEKLSSKKLSEISAKDFLDGLQNQGLLGSVGLIKKDKRVEYLLEPERLPDLDFKSLIEVIKDRKKWVEREKYPLGEVLTDPFDLVADSLVDRVARRVEERLEGRLGGLRR
jgi:hypothetical protein